MGKIYRTVVVTARGYLCWIQSVVFTWDRVCFPGSRIGWHCNKVKTEVGIRLQGTTFTACDRVVKAYCHTPTSHSQQSQSPRWHWKLNGTCKETGGQGSNPSQLLGLFHPWKHFLGLQLPQSHYLRSPWILSSQETFLAVPPSRVVNLWWLYATIYCIKWFFYEIPLRLMLDTRFWDQDLLVA